MDWKADVDLGIGRVGFLLSLPYHKKKNVEKKRLHGFNIHILTLYQIFEDLVQEGRNIF